MMERLSGSTRVTGLPAQLWLGLLLVVVFWSVNWLGTGLRTAYGFFPLWLGYILTVDGWVWWRRGTSLLMRNGWAFIGMFFISAPAWWVFEVLNWQTRNWEYLGRDQVSDLFYAVMASLSFSTVIPAVFETAEFVSTFKWVKRLRNGPVIPPTRSVTVRFFAAGLAMLILLLIWPRYFFPFLWLSVYFILEPINVWLGNRTLGEYTAVGNWRPVVALWLGGLICGFFWEMWNFFSFPKWIYHVPFVGYGHIFEMPLLGYGGYLPFALELFALYHLVIGLMGWRLPDYVQLGD